MTRIMMMFAGIAAAALMSVPASAAMEIRVDFNDAAGAPGGNWNTVAAPGAVTPPLIDFNTGASTGVTIDLQWFDVLESSSNTEWDAANSGPAWLDAAKHAAMDYFWGQFADAVGWVKVQNLTPGQAYSVELVASSDSSSAGPITYDINGVYFDGSTDGQFDPLDDGYTSGEWMTWSSIAADGTGVLELHYDIPTGPVGRNRMNAMRIVEVPEPASLALMGLGGLMMIGRRRK
jgi:hypothetical protein